MKTLVLHIGTHKTGTSSIQKFLRIHEQELRTHGWGCVSLDGNFNLSQAFEFTQSEQNQGFRWKRDQLKQIVDQIVDCPNCCIVSSEDMFFLNSESDLRTLHEQVHSHFDETLVIVYLRRQLELAISQKVQGAKTLQSAVIFGPDDDPLPLLSEPVCSYLNYDKKIELWSEVFGISNIKVRCYAPGFLIGGDSVSDFLTTCCIPIKPDAIKVNTRIGPQATLLLRRLKYFGAPHHEVLSAYRSGVIENDPGKPWLPTRKAAVAFQETFRQSNSRLYEKLGCEWRFSEEFDGYAKNSEVPTIEREYFKHNLLKLRNHARGPSFGSVSRAVISALDLLSRNNFSSNTQLQHLLELNKALHQPPIVALSRYRWIPVRLGMRSVHSELKIVAGLLALKALRLDIGIAIRDAAIVFEKTDSHLAQKLMKLAVRVLPNGPIINKKLLAYQTNSQQDTWINIALRQIKKISRLLPWT